MVEYLVTHDDMAMVAAARAALTAAGGLISLNGMANAWGVSRQQASLYSLEDGFPEPVPTDGTSRLVWIALEVHAWKAARGNLKLSR